MNKQRKLKKELKAGYRFQQKFSPATVAQMLTWLYIYTEVKEASTRVEASLLIFKSQRMEMMPRLNGMTVILQIATPR